MSRDYAHYVGLNQLWISGREFELLAYCYGDTLLLGNFFEWTPCSPWVGLCAFPFPFPFPRMGTERQSDSPTPEEQEKNWFSNFGLKFCIRAGLNESNVLWKLQVLSVFLYSYTTMVIVFINKRRNQDYCNFWPWYIVLFPL